MTLNELELMVFERIAGKPREHRDSFALAYALAAIQFSPNMNWSLAELDAIGRGIERGILL